MIWIRRADGDFNLLWQQLSDDQQLDPVSGQTSGFVIMDRQSERGECKGTKQQDIL